MALPWPLLPGCKKEAAPETQVTVQAEHPEQGPIAEHITADAFWRRWRRRPLRPRSARRCASSMCSADRG
jgi:hypothetical protein